MPAQVEDPRMTIWPCPPNTSYGRLGADSATAGGAGACSLSGSVSAGGRVSSLGDVAWKYPTKSMRAPAHSPSPARVARPSRRPLTELRLALLRGLRELLLLLLEKLRDGSRALDGELLDVAVGRTGQRVQELRDLVDLARLEERLEVVVREAHVARHLPFVGLQDRDDPIEVALRAVKRRKTQDGKRIVAVARDRLLRPIDRFVARGVVVGVKALNRHVRRDALLVDGGVGELFDGGDRFLFAVGLARELKVVGPGVDAIGVDADGPLGHRLLLLLVALRLRDLRHVERGIGIVGHEVLCAAQRALGAVELLLLQLRHAEREPVV